MSDNDVTWWKNKGGQRTQTVHDRGAEVPGDTDAADIVGRTGEEMPEVTHDDGDGEHPQDNIDSTTPQGVVRKSDH